MGWPMAFWLQPKPYPFSAGDEARLHFLSQAKERHSPSAMLLSSFMAGDEARLHFLSQAKENYEPTIGTLFI